MSNPIHQILAWRRRTLLWADRSAVRLIGGWTILFAVVFVVGRAVFHRSGGSYDAGVAGAVLEGFVIGLLAGWARWSRIASRAGSN